MEFMFSAFEQSKNLEADSAHETTHETDLSETYGTTPTHTKQLSMTRGSSCKISSLYWYRRVMICKVYARHMSSATWASAAARLLARRVFQAPLAASPLHLLRIFSVSATERQATRGCGLPKFHSQVLTSYTWLPLRYPWRGPSAQPNAKSRLCRR